MKVFRFKEGVNFTNGTSKSSWQKCQEKEERWGFCLQCPLTNQEWEAGGMVLR